MWKRILLFIFFGIIMHNIIRNGDAMVFVRNPIYAGTVVSVSTTDNVVQFDNNETYIIPNNNDADSIDTGSVITDGQDNTISNGNSSSGTSNVVEKKSNITLDDFKNALSDDKKVIGCIQKGAPFEVRKPNKNGLCGFSDGGIWFDISLPPLSHFDSWNSVYNGDIYRIIGALPIVNLESSFNPDARLYSYNGKYYKDPPFEGATPFVQGYVQTKYEYGISTDISEQLSWMKNRMDSQITGNCSQWSIQGSDRLLRCLYARHHGDSDGFAWYPSFNMKVRDYYIDYLSKK